MRNQENTIAFNEYAIKTYPTMTILFDEFVQTVLNTEWLGEKAKDDSGLTYQEKISKECFALSVGLGSMISLLEETDYFDDALNEHDAEVLTLFKTYLEKISVSAQAAALLSGKGAGNA